MKPQSPIRLSRVPRWLASRHFMHAGMALGVAALAASGAAIAILDPAAPAAKPASAPVAPTGTAGITVNVATPVETSFARAVAASGTVRARDELVIGSDIAGLRIVEVPVEVGSVVQAGQLLARADDSQLQAQLAQQEALIRQALAELAQAQANLERAEGTMDIGIYSVEALQTRRTAAVSAQARLELARAQKRELEVRIRQARVLAPAAGVVARKTVTLGAVVQNGNEMFRVIKDGQIEWLAELPGHALARVKPGAQVQVSLPGGRPVVASVRLVAPTIDAATRNGLVHVVLPPGTPLKAGDHAKGEILLEQTRVTAVPEAAVLTRDGYPFVYVVGPDHVARLVKLETGARQRGLVEVLAGLQPGARVVTTGAGFVHDGDLVRVAPSSQPSLAQLSGAQS
jgi:HlyD family secretion protein